MENVECRDCGLAPRALVASADAGEMSRAAADGRLPAIAALDAGLVALRQFPLRKWYYASPLWYYHRPAAEHVLKRDPRFFELVDPLLRELCRIVFDAGCCTTPSCEGHFYARARFEKIWQ